MEQGQQYITVVEDALSIIKLLDKLLTSKGYHVESFETAEEGLAAMQHRPPDMLITDLRLPGMSGMDLIHKVRQDIILQDIPIIMLSAHADLDTRVQGLEEADDFLGKPFHPNELYARVSALMRRRKSQGMHGALERMGGMPVVLQMLALGHQQGVLILDDGSNLHIDHGHIIAIHDKSADAPSASQDPKGVARAEHILHRKSGGFRFLPDMPLEKAQYRLSVNELLLGFAKADDEEQERVRRSQIISPERAQAALKAAEAKAAASGPNPMPDVPTLEQDLKHNIKGLVVLNSMKAAEKYMVSVGGIRSFEARERYSEKHEAMCVIFENTMFVVVVVGMRLNSLPEGIALSAE